MGARSSDSSVWICQGDDGAEVFVFQRRKNTARVVQSTSVVTHSLTVMPLIFASGKLEDMPMQIQKQNDRFPQSGVFDAKNLHVVRGYSHIMTKQTTFLLSARVCFPDALELHCNSRLLEGILEPGDDSGPSTARENSSYSDDTVWSYLWN